MTDALAKEASKKDKESHVLAFLSLHKALATRVVIVIVSASDNWVGGTENEIARIATHNSELVRERLYLRRALSESTMKWDRH